jgi:hypothetical protein
MTSRIVDKSPTKRIIRDNSPEKRRISTGEIAAAFGGEEVGSEVPHRGSPSRRSQSGMRQDCYSALNFDPFRLPIVTPASVGIS